MGVGTLYRHKSYVENTDITAGGVTALPTDTDAQLETVMEAVTGDTPAEAAAFDDLT